MVRQVFYKASVEKDLRGIGKAEAERVIRKFEHAFSSGSRAGESLKGRFAGLFKFRVGDYRVIYTNVRDGILVLRISRRREAYR